MKILHVEVFIQGPENNSTMTQNTDKMMNNPKNYSKPFFTSSDEMHVCYFCLYSVFTRTDC